MDEIVDRFSLGLGLGQGLALVEKGDGPHESHEIDAASDRDETGQDERGRDETDLARWKQRSLGQPREMSAQRRGVDCGRTRRSRA